MPIQRTGVSSNINLLSLHVNFPPPPHPPASSAKLNWRSRHFHHVTASFIRDRRCGYTLFHPDHERSSEYPPHSRSDTSSSTSSTSHREMKFFRASLRSSRLINFDRISRTSELASEATAARRYRGVSVPLSFSSSNVNAGNIAMLAPMVRARVTGAD